MPWNGAGKWTPDIGTFSGVDAFTREASSGRNVEAAPFDALLADLKETVENCLTRDGQTAPTQDIGINDRRWTDVGDATARAHFASMAQIQDGAPVFIPAADVGGDAQTMTITPRPDIPALAAGQRFLFISKHTITTDLSLEVGTHGAKDVVKVSGSTVHLALVANDIHTHDLIDVTYDGTRFLFRGMWGNAGRYNTGSSSGTIPVVQADGRLLTSIVPAVSSSSFDIHDDFADSETTVAATDRFIFSDESAQDDPTKYIEASHLRTYMQAGTEFDLHDDVGTQLIGLHADDRMVVSDESASGDPNRYVAMSTLKTFVGFDLWEDVPTEATSLAATDRLVFGDDSVSGDPNRYITATNARNFFRSGTVQSSDASTIDVLTQTAYDALGSPSSTTLYFTT